MASLSPAPKLQFFDAAGVPLVGGKLYSYQAGTTTPLATYTSQNGVTPNTNPVILDSRGEANVWLGVASYKLALYTATNVLVWTVDGIDNVDSGDGFATLAQLAAPNGSSLIGFLQAGTSAVARTAQAKMRERISVLDFGAVPNVVISGNNFISGADSRAAFVAALAAATAGGITRVYAPGGFYYLSAPITLPRGVTLEGDGTSHLPIVTQSSNRTGTCVLINGTAGADCLAFEENAGHSGLANLSVYNTNNNAIRSVVSVVGQLYPRMTNVEIASLKKTTGSGLWLSPSSAGAQYETLWGAFHNVIVTISNVGDALESSVRYGAQIYGLSSTKVCNANSFVSGQFAGTWAGLLMDGNTVDSGALSCVFWGVKFDTNWDGTNTPEFRTKADRVFGWLKNDCYVHPVVKIERGRDTAFHGCYFESAGAPATYNDGVNGSHTLIAVFYNGGGTTANRGTDILGSNWNSCYLYDNSQAARVDPIIFNRYATRLTENLLVPASGVQSIPASVWTRVTLAGAVQFGDDSFLEWDAANNAAKIRSPGTYLITGQFAFAGWAVGAGTWGAIRIQTDAGYNYQGPLVGPLAAAQPIIVQVQIVMNLLRGQSVWLEVFQNQGGAQNSSGANTRINVTKIV